VHWTDNLLCELIDVYASAGMLSRAESILLRMKQRCMRPYRRLMEAYGNRDRADQATRLLHKILHDTHVEPDLQMFNIVIDAWTKSSQPDSFEEAFATLRMTEHDDRCLNARIRPDRDCFHGLLQCLVESSFERAGLMASVILDTMQDFCRKGDMLVQPNAQTYRLAIQACFQAKDQWRADELLHRMEQSGVELELQTYNDSLLQHAQIGTGEAAERAQDILEHMHSLAMSNRSLKPTLLTYSTVLSAWAKSNDPIAADSMWRLYEQMKMNSVALDRNCYGMLLQHLAHSSVVKDLQRADFLLQEMENGACPASPPDGPLYAAVLKGFAEAGDVEMASNVLYRFVDAFLSNENNERLKPHRHVFHSVVSACIRSGDLVRATLVLETARERLDEYARQYPDRAMDFGPDRETFQALVSAWAQSQRVDKSIYVKRIKSKMR
jgi:Pentatricopeptide repeat domain/PPR repeat